jgi:hypothetical protein
MKIILSGYLHLVARAFAAALCATILAAAPAGAAVPSLSWNTFVGGASYDAAAGVAVDADGNSYVAGSSPVSWGTPLRAHSGGPEAFVAKFDAAGVLVWNTFLGGSRGDWGRAVVIDGDGNVYVVGSSAATWGVPVTAHADSSYDEVFVAKLDKDGALVWNTFLGGGSQGNAVALDPDGNVLVAGESNGSWGTPVSPPSALGTDGIVAKLGNDGALLWHTYLTGAGNDFDRAYGVATDATGAVYVTGQSNATWGAPLRAHAGGEDAFAAKLDADGALVWNTFLGGAAGDRGLAIAVDGAGSARVTGWAGSTWGAPVRAFGGGWFDAFVARLGADGSLAWNTFLGGLETDTGYGIVLGAGGETTVAGASRGAWGVPLRTFTPGVTTCCGPAADAFAARLGADGALAWNTFLGNDGEDLGLALALDAAGGLRVAGQSATSWGEPLAAHAEDVDGFLAALPALPPLRESLEDLAGVWTTGGAAPWYGQGKVSFDGVDAAASGAIGHGKSTWIKRTLKGSGKIAFQWRTSSEIGDKLTFWIDGVLRATRCGETAWQMKAYRVGPGAHTFKWVFKRNAAKSGGMDAGFVDQVTITK